MTINIASAEILEDAPGPNDTLSLQKARKIYNMCMDGTYAKFYKIEISKTDREVNYLFGLFVETLTNNGIRSLTRLVRNNGGWPMTMSRIEWQLKGAATWQEISNVLQDNFFENGLYRIKVMEDNKKSDTNVITVCILFLYFTKYKI